MLWAIAKDQRKVTRDLARKAVDAIKDFPWAELSEQELDEDITLATSQDACDRFNRLPKKPSVLSPPSFVTPVFGSNSEAIGYLNERAARAVVDVYHSIPGISVLCDALGAFAMERRQIDDEPKRRRLDEFASRDQDLLEGELESMIRRCDHALKCVGSW